VSGTSQNTVQDSGMMVTLLHRLNAVLVEVAQSLLKPQPQHGSNHLEAPNFPSHSKTICLKPLPCTGGAIQE
jgi:hypothetical protein